jgi:CRISPR/Cas system-associated endonuclease/helicase Cas3
VENRDAKGLKVGELEVRFENVGTKEINQFIQREEKFVMIESPAYFEAYSHVLEALKEIKPDEFPFQKHIVECCQDVGLPEYQVKNENSSEFTFNFADVLVARTPANPESPVSDQHQTPHSPPVIVLDSSSQEGQTESSNTEDPSTGMDVPMDQEMPSAEVKQEFSTNVYNWPDNESLGFNESQMRAFKMALTKKFAVIQGSPGTGKTYVGLKIARVLLQTASLWEDDEERSPILMVSYTNHALDQFLEGLLPVTKGETYLNV